MGLQVNCKIALFNVTSPPPLTVCFLHPKKTLLRNFSNKVKVYIKNLMNCQLIRKENICKFNYIRAGGLQGEHREACLGGTQGSRPPRAPLCLF